MPHTGKKELSRTILLQIIRLLGLVVGGGGVGLVVALSSLCPRSHLHDGPADEDKGADETDNE